MKNPLSFACVTAAHEIADAAHRGQTRADGVTEYVWHPERVAILTRWIGGSPVAVVAALLHDCVEDCAGFDLDAALARIPLSDADRARARAVILALTHRESEPNADYFRRVLDAPAEALLVKLVDRLDNVLDMADGFPEERLRRYCGKTEMFVRMVRDRAALLGHADLVAAIEEAVAEALDRLNTPARAGCAA